ncbi:TSSK6-activating co-chaperone protein [Neophocaena asiaeorientalis asiaeorientalis]|uniref:TSSK6-activating co-chaperone protein n=1 Tax=Neophocaena asiaeorientalis asiaeorientalis TaxID=1706337 RepID=A0A341BPW9_NEOAA|nr:TSSK6-activating co-chaperone protein [Neophocaena asiaeorientalis asiaeorientalis]
MAARCRAGYPELGEPAEPSGEREPAKPRKRCFHRAHTQTRYSPGWPLPAACCANLRASAKAGAVGRHATTHVYQLQGLVLGLRPSINTAAKEEGNAVPLCRAKPTPNFINLQASSPPATCLKIPATKLSSVGFSRGYMDVISQQIGYRPLINQAIHHYRPELHVYSTSGHFCHTK